MMTLPQPSGPPGPRSSGLWISADRGRPQAGRSLARRRPLEGCPFRIWCSRRIARDVSRLCGTTTGRASVGQERSVSAFLAHPDLRRRVRQVDLLIKDVTPPGAPRDLTDELRVRHRGAVPPAARARSTQSSSRRLVAAARDGAQFREVSGCRLDLPELVNQGQRPWDFSYSVNAAGSGVAVELGRRL